MSCSYGPGRYDPTYEEVGQDYPVGYVRWTEQRNMTAFLKLISNKSIDLKPLITHTFKISEAEKAYDIVLGKTEEPHVAILLKYPELKVQEINIIINDNPLESINTGFIGAGSFAQSYLIPNVKSYGASLDSVVTLESVNAKNVAQKFAFNNTSTDPETVLKKEDINVVFVATRHDSHSKFVIDSLRNGKHVFVEKPLSLTMEDLDEIKELYQGGSNQLMVGFNRRFSPAAVELKKQINTTGQPLVMNFRINAGFIPKDHWTQIAEIGGGRIIGEVCHFIDLMQFFTGSDPGNVSADCINTQNSEITNEDNLSITIKFKDGSLGNIIYLANGDQSMPKERLEVFCGGKIGVINDFKTLDIYADNKVKSLKLNGKGHKQEVSAFLSAIKAGEQAPISFQSIYLTTLTTFKIRDSLLNNLPQKIDNTYIEDNN